MRNGVITHSAFKIDEYTVYDYVYAYAARNWTVSGSQDGKRWIELNRQDEPGVNHILQKYTYSIAEKAGIYRYYRYFVLGGGGAHH